MSQLATLANTQSGVVGGGQFGYNFQVGPNWVIGFETDIQGSGSRGASSGGGGGAVGGGAAQQVAIGGMSVSAGLDYIGTARARVGYLLSPAMLVYLTGGLTYGGAYANVTTNANVGWRIGSLGFSQTYFGGGQQSQTLAGWNVGGGVEWMVAPGWSLKAESIYWNLGNLNTPTASFGSAGGVAGAVFGATQVNYQGVMARVGVNYHTSWLPGL
ncbi:outer membrane beta-barrel protein [Methylocystis sp. IM3]|jgi:outer membrane immunogenic protein|uniref:outer membrane protein n=1 Tax=unclassified Methylocystis TaxID=2625913 RepID=UPI000FAEBAC0|nr:MAG: hypothetical protein EKK29_02015 [Hyphomicrobiales bacterium]